jgi:hypothetical protein
MGNSYKKTLNKYTKFSGLIYLIISRYSCGFIKLLKGGVIQSFVLPLFFQYLFLVQVIFPLQYSK